jgi:hypothetical protein
MTLGLNAEMKATLAGSETQHQLHIGMRDRRGREPHWNLFSAIPVRSATEPPSALRTIGFAASLLLTLTRFSPTQRKKKI